jgi:hypothetical protein
MHTHIQACTDIQMHTHTHTHMNTHTRTHKQTHIKTHTNTYAHAHLRTHIHTHSHTHTNTHTHTHANFLFHTRTHTRTHIHISTHTHTHTGTQTHRIIGRDKTKTGRRYRSMFDHISNPTLYTRTDVNISTENIDATVASNDRCCCGSTPGTLHVIRAALPVTRISHVSTTIYLDSVGATYNSQGLHLINRSLRHLHFNTFR